MSGELTYTELKYKLVGPEAGKTVSKHKGAYRFVNGVMSVSVREDHLDKYKGLTRLLARSYNAHPEGSKALERAEAEWADHPQNVNKRKGVSDATGQRNKAGKAKADGEAVQGTGRGGADAGAEGHEAEAGDDLGTGDDSEDESTEIADGLAQLDPDNAAHWTSTGLVNLKALGQILGRNITRPEIEAAAPGFNQETAREQ